jgi:hypothetical protein
MPENDRNKSVQMTAEVAAAVVFSGGQMMTAEGSENELCMGSVVSSQQEGVEEQVAAKACGGALAAVWPGGRRMRGEWPLLRGGGGDGQEENSVAAATGGVMTAGGGAAGALAARGRRRLAITVKPAIIVKAADIAKFDEAADDDVLLKHVFDKIDTDKNASISEEELSNALQSEMSMELEEGLKKVFARDGSSEIDFERFKAEANQVSVFLQCASKYCCVIAAETPGLIVGVWAAAQVPRVKGERVQWVRTLGLEGLLAKHLPLGNFVDQLSGIKTMAEEELSVAVHLFISEVPGVVSAGLKKLKGRAASQFGSEVQEHINSKFTLDGAFMGKFATLDDRFLQEEKSVAAATGGVMTAGGGAAGALAARGRRRLGKFATLDEFYKRPEELIGTKVRCPALLFFPFASRFQDKV